MTPGTTLIATGAQAGYPQLGVPAGYNAANRDPVGIAFTGTAYSEAKLLAFGYAYEQAAKIRKPPSEINPSLWRCVPGNAYTVTTRACAPNEPANADVIAGTVGGTVPATLSLSLGTPATLRAVHAGRHGDVPGEHDRERDLHRGRRDAERGRPELERDGAARERLVLAGRRRCRRARTTAPTRPSADRRTRRRSTPTAVRSRTIVVTIGFKQAIGANEPLRTGAYAKTLTFTLSHDQSVSSPLTHLHARLFGGRGDPEYFRPFLRREGETMRGKVLRRGDRRDAGLAGGGVRAAGHGVDGDAGVRVHDAQVEPGAGRDRLPDRAPVGRRQRRAGRHGDDRRPVAADPPRSTTPVRRSRSPATRSAAATSGASARGWARRIRSRTRSASWGRRRATGVRAPRRSARAGSSG